MISPPAAGPTRTAVVGAGSIAGVHLEILTGMPDVEVVCLCDVDRMRAEILAARHGVETIETDLDALAALDVDVAHLCVPSDRHAALAERLLTSGIACFVEKPLATTVAQARALVARAGAGRVALGVNHNYVYHPTFTRLLACLESGAIGRLEHVQVYFSMPLAQLLARRYSHWMFEEPLNILLEQAVHPLSQLERLIGAVRTSHATVRTRQLQPGHLFHHRWSVAAEGERGLADLHLCFGASFARNTLAVIGTDGFLEADLHHGLLSGERETPWPDPLNGHLVGTRRGRALVREARRELWRWAGHTLGLAERSDAFWTGMRDSIRAFHAALRAKAQPLNDGARAVRVLEWCCSIAQGAPASGAAPAEWPRSAPSRDAAIVVTGAGGFIGQRLVARLLRREAPVTVVVRRRRPLPPEFTDAAAAGRLHMVLADLDNRAALAAAFENAAACVHLAAGHGDEWPIVERDVVVVARRLAELCLEHEVRLIHVSSVAALYMGPDAGTDLLSDDHAIDCEPEGRSLYARGKIATERALRELEAARRLRLVIARPGVVLGAGARMQHPGLGEWVRDSHCLGWGTGELPLPLVWVDDVAEALALAALDSNGALSGRAMNLAARVRLCAREVVEELAAHTGRDLHFHPRPMWLLQAGEVGKWLVKRVGRRRAPLPSLRDLKTRALVPALRCETARELLGWRPVEDREAFLERAVRVHRA
jgi:predicted dehydrogenase/nucleoside-diphosphate-sugar epimerase